MQADRPDINLARALSDAAAEGEATQARAAGIVEDYVQDQALSALDALLNEAGNGETVRETADRCTATSILVDTEVRRFRDLSARGR